MAALILAAALAQAAPAPDPCHLVTPPGPPRCPAWRRISGDSEDAMFADPASVRPEGDGFRMALRLVYPSAREAGMRSGVTLSFFDCARRTITMRHINVYDARGVLITEEDAVGENAVPEPVPDTGPFTDLLAEFCPAQGTAAAPDPCYAVTVATERPGCPVWQLIRRDAGVALFAEPASVRPRGTIFTIRTRMAFATPQPDGLSSSVMLADYDCRRRTVALRGLIAYDATGLRLPPRPVDTGPARVPDKSADARLLRRYCPR
jgi:hypothetical protein